ncbi:MAG: hypothetical protein Q4B29_02945 [Candidatus Saccharibacteria bacterium]|nr:hypothetical protein [Candidatus Saccharibacteria bacterium]
MSEQLSSKEVLWAAARSFMEASVAEPSAENKKKLRESQEILDGLLQKGEVKTDELMEAFDRATKAVMISQETVCKLFDAKIIISGGFLRPAEVFVDKKGEILVVPCLDNFNVE